MARDDSLWLEFAGVRSDAAGVRVLQLPALPAAAPRGEQVEIEGRDGMLWLEDGGYESIELTARMLLRPGTLREDVAAWLHGAGRLVLSDQPEFCWRARIIDPVDFLRDSVAPGSRAVEVTFTCQPWRYLVDEDPLPDITEPMVLVGQGTWFARPAITVYGSGDINLLVNGVSVLLDDVDGHITLDCDAMMAFKDGVNVSPKVTLMGGESDGDDEWPRLNPSGAANLISWSGDVTRVVIQPNWRWR